MIHKKRSHVCNAWQSLNMLCSFTIYFNLSIKSMTCHGDPLHIPPLTLVGTPSFQVLVSIQGLVLVPKPYFNEAGYDRQTGTGEGERNSIVYNENAFILSCKYVLFLLRKPPMVPSPFSLDPRNVVLLRKTMALYDLYFRVFIIWMME